MAAEYGINTTASNREAAEDAELVVLSIKPQTLGKVERFWGTLWRECVERMVGDGVRDFYEIGIGKVLSGLVKRIATDVNATPVGLPEDLDAAHLLTGK